MLSNKWEEISNTGHLADEQKSLIK